MNKSVNVSPLHRNFFEVTTFQSRVCTLILPKRYFRKFSGSGRALQREFGNLLEKYENILQKMPRINGRSVYTKYQRDITSKKKIAEDFRQSSPFIRINVRVTCVAWTRLGILAVYHGVSRCFLFSYLLEMDSVGGKRETEIKSSTQSSVRIILQLIGNRYYIVSRIEKSKPNKNIVHGAPDDPGS
ncbi:hypothetical protein CH373_01250 [Leptospira perolatii]|uniref:DUF1564 domain-containing protein n=1 Tax=Leptospira perolatii TaxID=2023191 RepID=A0A2M9ZRJ7_9LEPT|nr:hypothetical protein CH360_01250 [Leptospira perolatii]PJZ74706.1 hypothetical protein CH373_01250 [Leptospira perolatii]